jgi:hypothetical protein
MQVLDLVAGLMQTGHAKALLQKTGYKIRGKYLWTRTCTSTKPIAQ